MAHCGCKNGRGGPKNMHRSREAALDQAIRFLKSGMGHTPYPCPKRPGVWHLRTERRKK